jgi:hypothetical protein
METSGIKVIYHNLLVDIFNAPPLTTKRGKWLWFAIVPVYWSIAYIFAASIPRFLRANVSGGCDLHLCSLLIHFHPLLALGYVIKKNAICKMARVLIRLLAE